MIEELLRRSSVETRRAVDSWNFYDAVDFLVCAQENHHGLSAFKPWHLRVVAELRRSGAPVKPEHAAALLPPAAQRGAELDAELAASAAATRAAGRAHDCFVPLAFDHLNAREADEGVRRREARMRELEEALRERGG